MPQLKYSFDELKVVSVIWIWNNVKKERKERKKRNVSPEFQKMYVGAI